MCLEGVALGEKEKSHRKQYSSAEIKTITIWYMGTKLRIVTLADSYISND